jgi:hypothetical protein
MFICTPCCKASGLHERLAKSAGQCEVCLVYTVCDDWPSSQIPEGVTLVAAVRPKPPAVNQQVDDELRDILNGMLNSVDGSRVSWHGDLVDDTIIEILDAFRRFVAEARKSL